jgi:excisionase family DNA binding protein
VPTPIGKNIFPKHQKDTGESQKSANLPVLYIRHPKSIYPLPMKNLIERTKTAAEVADLLRKKQQVIEKMARRKEIPAFKIGSTWRFDPADLAKWLETQKEAK